MDKVTLMLEVAKEQGFTTLREAYSCYVSLYNGYLSVENYHEQYRELVYEMVNLGLISNEVPDEFVLNDMTIEEALAKICNPMRRVER